MVKTLPGNRTALQAELDKGIESGFLIKTKNLPIETQDFLWAQPTNNFVAMAPAYKLESLSTPIRFTFNFSKKDHKTKLSLNDLSLTGMAKLDMSHTARIFNSSKFLAVGDVAKFYNQIVVSQDNLATQLFVWRDNGCPTNPLRFFDHQLPSLQSLVY